MCIRDRSHSLVLRNTNIRAASIPTDLSHSLVIRNTTIRAACIPTDLSHSQVMRNVRAASNRPVP